ncbi:Mth938-like domain-containing protein [Methylobrevis pamukkalensis]|nr:Mth938-like domain-containing protein [Methylobrevis pamukkalensis]
MTTGHDGRGTPQEAVRREAHFPGRAPVDAYGDGGFRFAGMSHRGSLLCVPSGIYGWPVTTAAEITGDSLERVLGEGAAIDLLLLGTGRDLIPPSERLRLLLSDRGIRIDVMSTGAAIRTYNILLGEGRPVAAALIAVG